MQFPTRTSHLQSSMYPILPYHHSYPLNYRWGLPKNDIIFSAFQATFKTTLDTWMPFPRASYRFGIGHRQFYLEELRIGSQLLSKLYQDTRLPPWTHPDTLSLFTVYMSHHTKPASVATYLSGICQQLKPYFPNIHSACNSALVHHTLQGCKCLHAVPTSCKHALTLDDLHTVVNSLQTLNDYDDRLFLAQLLTGFFVLLCLGEMTYPDDPKLCDPKKVTKHNSVQVYDTSFQFFLPGNKANRFFEGNKIIVCKNSREFNPHKFFTAYFHVQDKKFPLSSPLWLTSKGAVPTCSFFIKHLWHFFHSDTAGQSLWAGGTTSLAENGVPPSNIQAIGRWASNTFKIYIRKNPVLIQALLFGQTACSWSSFIHALDS